MHMKKLLNLIKKSEGPKLDFKLKIDLDTESGRKELAKDICAIANSKGGRGYLIIGVEDKHKTVEGIEEITFAEEQIQQIISSRCEPPIPISLELLEYDNKRLAVITIYDGGQKPYQVRENGAFYIRRGSTTDTMRKQELISAFQENLTINVELCSMIKSNIQCLNKALVMEYFSSQGIVLNDDNYTTFLENASIVNLDKESNEYVCTLGGLLVFSSINNIFVPHNMIRIINKINKDFYEVNIVQGDLLQILDKSEELICKILPRDYPVEAVNEAIKNAVLYRDYTIFDKEIEVVIDFNSISVISPGILVRGNNIHSHNYLRRNMWIYEKLIALDTKKRFIKSGRGFSRMKKTVRSYGKVIFVNSMQNNCFKVIFPGIKVKG